MLGTLKLDKFQINRVLRRWHRHFVPLNCALLLASVVNVATFADAPPSVTQDKAIEELIAALVSPNREPRFASGDPDNEAPEYSVDYDKEAQKRVQIARDTLLAKGIVAFPQLIQQIGDRRYSFTEQRQKTLWANVFVSDVCSNLVRIQVEVYQPLVSHSRSSKPLCFWVPGGKEEMKKWWEAHKHSSLHEIQLEGARWALEHQRKARFANKAEESAVLGDLVRLIRRLESSNRPILVNSDGSYRNEPTLKPTEWTLRGG